MAEGRARPGLYTIPAHRSFADALVAGLLRAHGRAPDALAHGLVLVPNNRAARTFTEAFVRASGGGLILPRLVAIGDSELEERLGGAFDPLDLADPIPPAIDPLDRQLLLARLLGRSGGEGLPERMRMAADMARAIDALHVEEKTIAELGGLKPTAGDLPGHWERAYHRFEQAARALPEQLAVRGRIDLAARRNRLLRQAAERWTRHPPAGFVVAAGITTAAPAVVELLKAVVRLERGMVVFPALALADAMPDAEWEALRGGEGRRAEATHPQYHLQRLLDRMGYARDEVEPWSAGGPSASTAARGRAVVHALTAPAFTDKWPALAPAERRLTGVRAAEFADPSDEAQGIALKLREALETEGRTASLVTPDRTLAGRVAAHLRRWGVEADDSAGRALSDLPAGSLLLGIAGVIEEGFAPVALLALLKHPLVGGEGEARRDWLRAVRKLDLALRGPRPVSGLSGLDRHFEKKKADEAWRNVRPLLEQVESAFEAATTLAGLAGALREAMDRLAGERAWRNPDGRAAAQWIETVESSVEAAATPVDAADVGALLRAFLEQVPVRPPYGTHPRIAILGLLEARLQQSDLVILGGLNEGVWPRQVRPDPWLAPRLRRELDLPGLDYGQGLAAHDFMSALGAPEVLITRAARDGRSPTVASRLWLRLEALTGGLTRDEALADWTRRLDRRLSPVRIAQPAPVPPAEWRPRRIAVTDFDRLKADPFAFYAKAVLKLRRLEPVDAEHSAAWRGTAVHDVLQAWFDDDRCDPATLSARIEAMLADDGLHPMLRALWAPRLREAVEWVAATIAADRADGREPLLAEEWGERGIDGVTLYGKVDRIDRMADGGLAIVDYKTGKPPAAKAVREGYSLQLGLLGLIAEIGGFDRQQAAPVEGFEYWSLARDDRTKTFGYRRVADKTASADEFLATSARHFSALVGQYLNGTEPFHAKLHPEHAPYGDYDQLMRLAEWYGREAD